MTIKELDDKLNSPGFQDTENGDLFYNFFIYQYPAEKEYDIRRQIQEFKANLIRPINYVDVLTLNLFEEFCNFLDQKKFLRHPSMLKYQLEKEQNDPSKAQNTQDTLTRNAHSPEFVQYIHQRIIDHITIKDQYRRPYVFLYGIGSMFPYLRVNEFLALYEDYNDTGKYKIIVFYPGHRDQNSFRLFDTLPDNTTYGKPGDFYPLYDSLHIEAKSDAVDIEESDITVKNDTIAVRCYNNYTDATGTFKQDSITLFIAKDKESSWYIYDSKGLVTMDEDQEWFGRATGALGMKQLNDVALAQRLSKLSDLISTKYWDTWAELRTKVKIVNWSWETSYDGTAHGDARIVNTLPYSISGIKYLVTYYDRSGNFMAEDDGRVSKTLNPSEKYNFTFWSSNAKYPTTANLRLDFSDKTVLELMKEKTYTGKEFAEFIKKK